MRIHSLSLPLLNMRFIENATDYNEGIVLAGIADRYGPCVGALKYRRLLIPAGTGTEIAQS